MRMVTTVFIFFFVGCLNSRTTHLISHRPGLLGTVAFEEEAGYVYDEVFTLAFERGYKIVYASREEWMIEVDLPTVSSLLGGEWVQRIALLVREREGHSILYTRYHSYNPDGGHVRVNTDDRKITETFVAELKHRLTPRVLPGQ